MVANDETDSEPALPLPDASTPVKPDKAPRRSRTSAGRGLSETQVAAALAGYYVMLGMLVLPNNQYDGTVIVERAPDLASSVVAVGRRNKRVWRVLVMLATGGDYTQLVMVHLAVASAIAANHGQMSWRVPQALGMPLPTEATDSATPLYRQAQPASAPTPTQAEQAAASPPGWEQAVYPEPQFVEPNGASGNGNVQISAAQIARIVEEAKANALREAQQAGRQGFEGVPPATHDPSGGR